MADDERVLYEDGGGTVERVNGERRRERATRDSDRDREKNRERDRDRGKDRRHRDVDLNREKDRGGKDRDREMDREKDRVRDREWDMDRDRHRSHDRERRGRDYGGDRDRRQRHRSRSSSRGRSRDISRSRSRSRSRSKKTSGFDRAAPGAGVASSGTVPGIRFQAASNGNLSGELQPQQSSKAAVDGALRSNPGADSQQPEVHDGELQGNRSAAASVTKLGKSSKWGPAPSSEDAMSSEVANDFEAAKVAAIRAAELVNKNLSLAGFMSADHKKKLLWGGKKAQVEQEPVVAAAGTNRWDTVHFSDRDRMEKFHKLMGVKGDIKEKEPPPPAPGAAIFTEEKQRALQEDLEKQFTQGLRRRDGRTVGLGL